MLAVQPQYWTHLQAAYWVASFAFGAALVACQSALMADGCPKDALAAVGSTCPSDGKTCGTSSPGFTHFIRCSGGKWTEMEAAQPPQPSSVPSGTRVLPMGAYQEREAIVRNRSAS